MKYFIFMIIYLFNCNSIDHKYDPNKTIFTVTYKYTASPYFNRKVYNTKIEDLCLPDYDLGEINQKRNAILYILTLNTINIDRIEFTCYKRDSNYGNNLLKDYLKEHHKIKTEIR